jgi:hypothetical protein
MADEDILLSRNSSTTRYRRRIIIDDESSDEESDVSGSGEVAVNPPARRRALMRSTSLGDLSDSSSSLEGYLEKLQISPSEVLEDEETIADGYIAAVEEVSANEGEERGKVKVDDGVEAQLESPWAFNKSADEFYFDTSIDKKTRWPKFIVPGWLFRKLYGYQVTGIRWMGGLYFDNIGGVLGDDMGMVGFLTSCYLLLMLYYHFVIR